MYLYTSNGTPQPVVLALAGALVYAAAYSAELITSLAIYFSGSPRP